MMRNQIFPAALILAVLLVGGVCVANDNPRWIWTEDGNSEGASISIRRSFHVNNDGSTASLRYASDGADYTVLLDGVVVASAEAFGPLQSTDLGSRVDRGVHLLEVFATAAADHPSLFVQLNLQHADQTEESIHGDQGWHDASGRKAMELDVVDPRLLIPDERRVGIDVVDNYEQWKQALSTQQGTDPTSFWTTPGFEVQLVRSALAEEDSWVSLAVDPKGRLVIAKESAGLIRMTLSPDGSDVVETEVIEDTLKECRGLAFLGDDLFVNANNSKGLYRLRANDDSFAEPELVHASRGGVGHGRNDLTVGPDGKLYSIHGDAVELPSDAKDYTSLFRDARRGRKTSEGHLLRIEPESGQTELLVAGLRNPFGIDFNEHGEAFTYDADAEYDMGSPWYRPTRVNHLVLGGDYGWRGVTKSWPPYYPDHPDNAPHNLDIGKGSPTAVKFAKGRDFPVRYRESLFVLDWAYGRILAVHMIPRGSSYLMASETFLKGRPLNVTDLEFGVDGSMYFVTGGRKTQSALYRVRYTGNVHQPIEVKSPVARTTRNRSATEARELRRELEARLMKGPSADQINFAWNELSNPDPWIQHAAANLLEQQPTESWQSRALEEPNVTRAVRALTSLARSHRSESASKILDRLNELLPKIESPRDMHLALYSYWICVGSPETIDERTIETTATSLDRQYPYRSKLGSSYQHNRLLSEILVQLDVSAAVPKTMALLRQAISQTEQMHYLHVLRSIRTGWSIDLRREYFAGLAQAADYLGGAGMSDFLNKIREEAIETLSEEERKRLGLIVQGPAAPSHHAIDLSHRPHVNNWTVDELIQDAQLSSGDRVNGAKIFQQASCANCHRYGTLGTLIGPDLTAASSRFNRHDLLVSMIEPSKVIAENYRSLQIVTGAGVVHVGHATVGGDYRSPTLTLATDPLQPFKTIEVQKSEIVSQKRSDVSWMPKGLLDSFTKSEIADLLALLASPPDLVERSRSTSKE